MTFVINSIRDLKCKKSLNWTNSKLIHGIFQINRTFLTDVRSDSHSLSALDGSEFLPGLLGLNNIKENDSLNASLQLLLRVRPLRDYFLRPENYADPKGNKSFIHSFIHSLSLISL
jgi:hypothetical protein